MMFDSREAFVKVIEELKKPTPEEFRQWSDPIYPCPKCGGKILLRKSAKGNKYYACEKGKECGFMTWDEPTDKRCPQCGKTLFKRRGGLLVCLDEGCGYQEKAERKKKSAGKTAKK